MSWGVHTAGLSARWGDTRCGADRKGKESQCGHCQPPPPRWEVPAGKCPLGWAVLSAPRPGPAGRVSGRKQPGASRACVGGGGTAAAGGLVLARSGRKERVAGQVRDVARGGSWGHGAGVGGGWLRKLGAKERLLGSPALENQLSRQAHCSGSGGRAVVDPRGRRISCKEDGGAPGSGVPDMCLTSTPPPLFFVF